MMNQIIRYKPIIDFIRKNKPKNILEVGSGSKGIGKFMRNLNFTGLDMTTADYSREQKKTSSNMHFVNGDSLAMPFEDSSFELVFSLDMIEHIPEAKRLDSIREILRVSNKYAIIAFPFGTLGSSVDRLFYEYELFKNGKVEGWLDEHIRNGLPDETFIESIKREFDKNEIIEFYNCNIFFCVFIGYLEQNRIICKFLNVLSRILAYMPITFKSKYGIRKFVVIIKEDDIKVN